MAPVSICWPACGGGGVGCLGSQARAPAWGRGLSSSWEQVWPGIFFDTPPAQGSLRCWHSQLCGLAWRRDVGLLTPGGVPRMPVQTWALKGGELGWKPGSAPTVLDLLSFPEPRFSYL